MAKVHVQVTGGQIAEKEANTIGELKELLGVENYQATVNGEPEDDEYDLNDFEVVTLAPKVKGA